VPLHPLLLEILVCPDCKGTLTVDTTNNELVCDDCGLIYPIRDEIPIMLVSAARRPDGGQATGSATDADAGDSGSPVEASDDDRVAGQPTDR
jgi:uncharacterized protein YbaR (Trm112 family)